MIYINETSSISYSTSENGQFSSNIDLSSAVEKELNPPVYKELISPSLLRRMSPIVRMGVASASRCMNDELTDGIIVGTGLGCLKDTEKFLSNFVHSDDGTLSPTAFIQSTHNTIAGQIALIFKNHGYNMTYVQNGISFETALLDAFLQIKTKEANSFIVGGVDEKTPILDTLADAWGLDGMKENLSEGASFFKISNNEANSQSRIKDVHCINDIPNSIEASVQEYMKEIGEDLSDTTILYLDNTLLSNEFKLDHINITALCGQHFSNAAFGMHLGSSLLGNATEIKNQSVKSQVLVVNNYNNKQLGLVLLSK